MAQQENTPSHKSSCTERLGPVSTQVKAEVWSDVKNVAFMRGKEKLPYHLSWRRKTGKDWYARPHRRESSHTGLSTTPLALPALRQEPLKPHVVETNVVDHRRVALNSLRGVQKSRLQKLVLESGTPRCKVRPLSFSGGVQLATQCSHVPTRA